MGQLEIESYLVAFGDEANEIVYVSAPQLCQHLYCDLLVNMVHSEYNGDLTF